MNRIEERLTALKSEGKKAFITYTTAGLPDYETTKKIMFAQERAGVDIMEIGTTLKENGLIVLDEICDISARVIVNKTSYKLKRKEINTFLDRIKTVI